MLMQVSVYMHRLNWYCMDYLIYITNSALTMAASAVHPGPVLHGLVLAVIIAVIYPLNPLPQSPPCNFKLRFFDPQPYFRLQLKNIFHPSLPPSIHTNFDTYGGCTWLYMQLVYNITRSSPPPLVPYTLAPLSSLPFSSPQQHLHWHAIKLLFITSLRRGSTAPTLTHIQE